MITPATLPFSATTSLLIPLLFIMESAREASSSGPMVLEGPQGEAMSPLW